MKKWMQSSAMLLMSGTMALGEPGAGPAKADPVPGKPPMGENDAREFLAIDVRLARPIGVATMKIPYCGVGTVEIMPVLADQLKLTPGLGLVVDLVESQSPAEKNGVKMHDILLKMDDQILVNPEQMRVVMRSKKPGDTVTFSVLRKGSPLEVKVQLGERELPVEDAMMLGGGMGGPGGMGGGGVMGLAMPGNNDDMVWTRTMTAPPGGGKIRVMNDGVVQKLSIEDGTGRLDLQMSQGKATEATSVDPQGKTTFTGKVATEEERKKVPVELLEKITRAEKQANEGGPGGAIMGGGLMFHDAPPMDPRRIANRVGRNRVVTLTAKETLIVASINGSTVNHVLAFNLADGKTIFEGDVISEDQRKGAPAPVMDAVKEMEKDTSKLKDFGVAE